jgi:hypothetical protein
MQETTATQLIKLGYDREQQAFEYALRVVAAGHTMTASAAREVLSDFTYSDEFQNCELTVGTSVSVNGIEYKIVEGDDSVIRSWVQYDTPMQRKIT